jgi:predicted transcriptional regulator
VEVIAAYVANNSVIARDLPYLMKTIYAGVAGVTGDIQALSVSKSAVPVKKSITKDHLICLEDGHKFQSLKRYLMTAHGLSPKDYRTKWDLPEDYPMVAPAYASARSELAKEMGLGRRRKAQRQGAVK